MGGDGMVGVSPTLVRGCEIGLDSRLRGNDEILDVCIFTFAGMTECWAAWIPAFAGMTKMGCRNIITEIWS